LESVPAADIRWSKELYEAGALNLHARRAGFAEVLIWRSHPELVRRRRTREGPYDARVSVTDVDSNASDASVFSAAN
jgi:hypothetical protein